MFKIANVLLCVSYHNKNNRGAKAPGRRDITTFLSCPVKFLTRLLTNRAWQTVKPGGRRPNAFVILVLDSLLPSASPRVMVYLVSQRKVSMQDVFNNGNRDLEILCPRFSNPHQLWRQGCEEMETHIGGQWEIRWENHKRERRHLPAKQNHL